MGYKYTNTNTQILRGEGSQIHKYKYINIERRRVTNSAGKRTIRWHDVRNIRNTPISLIHWIWEEEGVEILEKEIKQTVAWLHSDLFDLKINVWRRKVISALIHFSGPSRFAILSTVYQQHKKRLQWNQKYRKSDQNPFKTTSGPYSFLELFHNISLAVYQHLKDRLSFQCLVSTQDQNS